MPSAIQGHMTSRLPLAALLTGGIRRGLNAGSDLVADIRGGAEHAGDDRTGGVHDLAVYGGDIQFALPPQAVPDRERSPLLRHHAYRLPLPNPLLHPI